MSAAWVAYRTLAPAIGALAPAARAFAPGAERALWNERMGDVRIAGGCAAWIHGASMGESLAAAALSRGLAARAPDSIRLLTSTTRTARARLLSLGERAALAPIDSPQAVRRFLAGVRPKRLFVVETEIWPHWLLAARSEALPVAFVSARLSERSVRGYRRLGAPLRGLLAAAAAVLCQSEDDARRWIALGARAERVAVTGNLKFDALPGPEADRAAARAALGLDPHRPALALGSLRPGEGRVLAGAWSALPEAVRARWQVIAVPRHAAAVRGLEQEAARAAGIGNSGSAPPVASAWRWDARPGVLSAYYGASEAAFVGGSLVPLGGHNPLEPAARGAAVLMGEHHSHQRQAVESLARGGGIVIANPDTVAARLARLLEDDDARHAEAHAGLAVVAALRGAAARSVAELEARGLWPLP